LIIGSDTRAFVDSAADEQHFGDAQGQSGQRSDTIMVAHVDPTTGTGMLVSFPRDLWVDIPGAGKSRINAAFNIGPQRVIETIKQDFDVDINHYLEVNFAGFRDIVSALGSVPLFFPAPARDKKTGLNVPEAGCQNLNGEQAFAYVRSRFY
jgi:LCP family protein required for cell wall assembly